MYLVIDIETADAPPDAVEMEKTFIKSNKNTKVEATKQKQIAEKQANLKLALLDSAPVSCIGMKTPDHLISFSTFPLTAQERETLGQSGIQTVCTETETEMLQVFGAYLDTIYTEDLELISHNGKESYKGDSGFDIPHLRFRYAYYGIPKPRLIKLWAPNFHFDIMHVFPKYFSLLKAGGFVSLDEVAKRLGLGHKLTGMSGAMSPVLVKEGKYVDALLGNIWDVLLEEQCYLKMIS